MPSGIKEEIANPHTELDARLLEMYKDRNLQPHDPTGQSPIVNLPVNKADPIEHQNS